MWIVWLFGLFPFAAPASLAFDCHEQSDRGDNGLSIGCSCMWTGRHIGLPARF
jgi:hypothetical protein